MSEAPAIGIDLGTTYSCVGVFRHGKVEIISNDQGNRTTPSFVAFTEEQILLGDPAKAQERRNLNNTIFDAKRLIGRKFNDATVQTDMENWPFKIVNVNNKPKIQIVVDGETKTFFPEEISSMVLVKMKEIAEAYLDKTVTKAVITVPAYFNDSQRQSTKDAATIAKLKVLRIINEPTAAALAYGLQKKVNDERTVMIFDLGGGTFDVSILNIAPDFCEVVSTAGDTHLGGEDFDNRLVNHFVDEFKRKHKKDLRQNQKAIRRLKTACERAKRTLSSSTLASLDGLDSLHEGIDFYSSITRARFEELNAELFQKTLEPVEKSIRDAGMSKSQIQEIVLVGGSTRIPKVQKLLQDFFNGKKLSKSINPDEAVAYGAAIQAAILNGDTSKEVQDLVLVDVIPLSLGIEVGFHQDMSVVVKRNTPIPTKQTGIFCTSTDNQTSAAFRIYEGEHPKTTFNNPLGSFTLDGIPPAPQGVARLEAIFDIDANGILNVTAVDQLTENTNGITLTYNKSQLSHEEIQRMINNAENYKAKEKKRKAVLVAKNSLESFCITLMTTVQDKKLIKVIIESDKKLIVQKCNEIIEWLYSDNSMEVTIFEHKRDELKDIFNAIITVPEFASDREKEEKIYCEVLNVTRDATEPEIREGYRQAVRKYHPDKFKGDRAFGQFSQLMFRVAVNAKKFFTSQLNGKKK